MNPYWETYRGWWFYWDGFRKGPYLSLWHAKAAHDRIQEARHAQT